MKISIYQFLGMMGGLLVLMLVTAAIIGFKSVRALFLAAAPGLQPFDPEAGSEPDPAAAAAAGPAAAAAGPAAADAAAPSSPPASSASDPPATAAPAPAPAPAPEPTKLQDIAMQSIWAPF